MQFLPIICASILYTYTLEFFPTKVIILILYIYINIFYVHDNTNIDNKTLYITHICVLVSYYYINICNIWKYITLYNNQFKYNILRYIIIILFIYIVNYNISLTYVIN